MHLDVVIVRTAAAAEVVVRGFHTRYTRRNRHSQLDTLALGVLGSVSGFCMQHGLNHT